MVRMKCENERVWINRTWKREKCGESVDSARMRVRMRGENDCGIRVRECKARARARMMGENDR